MSRPKRPRDPAQLAKLMVDIATGEVEDTPTVELSETAQSAALNGKKGGEARAAALTAGERKALSSKAAKARWQKESPVPARKEPA